MGNTVRKVLHHIREEYSTATQNVAPKAVARSGFSISNFVLMGQPKKQPTAQKTLAIEKAHDKLSSSDSDSFAQGLKPVLLEAIQDVLDELETVYDNISKGAKDHIHSEYVSSVSSLSAIINRALSEIILTIGKSKTVDAYLKSAAHHRKFTVIVAETAPSYVLPD